MEEETMVGALKTAKDHDLVSKTAYEQILPKRGSIPRLYWSPKTLKSSVPVGPTMNMNTSPYHQVACCSV